MPHAIDRHVMEELQCTWPSRFDETSSHRYKCHEIKFFLFDSFSCLNHELFISLSPLCLVVFRFRHAHDMQYGFSYYYFLMNVKQDFDLHAFWRQELDLGSDSVVAFFLFSFRLLPTDLFCLSSALP